MEQITIAILICQALLVAVATLSMAAFNLYADGALAAGFADSDERFSARDFAFAIVAIVAAPVFLPVAAAVVFVRRSYGR
jgi:hypothetical protein